MEELSICNLWFLDADVIPLFAIDHIENTV